MKLKYICQYCFKEYTNKYVLNRHLKTHIEYKPKEYLWQCKYCSDKLPNTYIFVPARIGPGNGIMCIKHHDIGIDF